MSIIIAGDNAGSGRIQFLLSGITPNIQLPNMELVREEAAAALDLRNVDSERPRIILTDGRTGKIIPDPVSDALVYNNLLKHLFQWSYFVHMDDVPDDLLEECVWSLEMFIRVLDEGSEAQLRAMGHITRATPTHNVGLAKETMFLNAKMKVATHMLKPRINRPADAAKHLMYSVDYSRRSTSRFKINDPNLFVTYAEALIRSGTNYKEAKKVLQEQLKSTDTTAEGLYTIVKCKVWLARLLRIQKQEDAAKEYEKWLVKWFRKNPHLLPDRSILALLAPGGDTTGPVLEELGGMAWLENRKHTDKTDNRLAKECRQCGAREPLVKLSVCAKCKKIYYCSTECQRKNWRAHKAGCGDLAELNDRLALLSLAKPSDAQREKEFHAWIDVVDNTPLVSALNLYRDIGRGRTHIVFQQVAYTPKAAREARTKFRVLRCGVFRVADVLGELERIMRLNAGEGSEYVAGVFDEMEMASRGRGVPFMILTYGKGVQPWLGGDAVPLNVLHERPYDPDWRKTLNPNRPPALLGFQDEKIKDAEHDFCYTDVHS